MKNVVLISNPLAGAISSRRSHQIRAAAAILRKSGIETAIQFTSKPGDGERLARAAVSKGCELMIACGGDGTINEIINGMTPGHTPLAILPGGTANISARELRLPRRIVKAAGELPSWGPYRISLGRARWEKSGSPCQRYFLAVAGIGFDAHIISQLNLRMKHRVGVLAYGWEAIHQTFKYGFPRFQFVVNGSIASATFAVIQRSSRYAGWLRVARSQSLCDPSFSSCVFKSSGRARYFQYALGILTGTHHWLSDVSFFGGSRIRCTVERPEDDIYFEVDGEIAGRLPVTFDVIPDALTILAPRSFITTAQRR